MARASSLQNGAWERFRAWVLVPLQGAAARRVDVCAFELGGCCDMSLAPCALKPWVQSAAAECSRVMPKEVFLLFGLYADAIKCNFQPHTHLVTGFSIS